MDCALSVTYLAVGCASEIAICTMKSATNAWMRQLRLWMGNAHVKGGRWMMKDIVCTVMKFVMCMDALVARMGSLINVLFVSMSIMLRLMNRRVAHAVMMTIV